MLWEWVKENLDRILDAVGHGLAGFRTIVSIMLGQLSTREQWEDVKAFFEGRDTKSYNVYLAQCLDMILSTAVWVERDREDVEKWLTANGYTKDE
jgi:aminopeptidase 2